MAVRNVDDDSTRALKQVTGKLESTLLLPVLKGTGTVQPPIIWVAPDDMFASSSSQNIPDSQGTAVIGVNLFSQCSVDAGKVTPGSELQGSSITDQLVIQRASSQELRTDQSPHLGVSEQSPTAHTGTVASLQGTSEIQRACSQEIQE